MPFYPTFTATRLLSAVLALLILGGGKQQPEARPLILAESFHRAPADWDRYQLANGEVSVQLPSVPAMTTYELRPEPLAKSRLQHLIAAYSQGVVYAIYVFERRQSLEEFIHSFRHSSETNFKRELSIAGVPGREYVFQNDTRKGASEYFITKRRIYLFESQGSLLGNPDIGLLRFFDSIRFERPVAGRGVVDGAGEPPAEEVSTATNGTNVQGLTVKETEVKAIVITKPEPSYTEEARRKNISGTVVLRCVFSSSGVVKNIQVSRGLTDGLTEKAIAAASQIKFIPAIKNGHFVSMYMQLEYNFNLY